MQRIVVEPRQHKLQLAAFQAASTEVDVRSGRMVRSVMKHTLSNERHAMNASVAVGRLQQPAGEQLHGIVVDKVDDSYLKTRMLQLFA